MFRIFLDPLRSFESRHKRKPMQERTYVIRTDNTFGILTIHMAHYDITKLVILIM